MVSVDLYFARILRTIGCNFRGFEHGLGLCRYRTFRPFKHQSNYYAGRGRPEKVILRQARSIGLLPVPVLFLTILCIACGTDIDPQPSATDRDPIRSDPEDTTTATVRETTDAWRLTSSSVTAAPADTLFSFAGGVLWRGGDNHLFSSRDLGRNWTRIKLDLGPGFRPKLIAMGKADNAWLVVQHAEDGFVLMESQDGGEVWSERARFPHATAVALVQNIAGTWVSGVRLRDPASRHFQEGFLIRLSTDYDTEDLSSYLSPGLEGNWGVMSLIDDGKDTVLAVTSYAGHRRVVRLFGDNGEPEDVSHFRIGNMAHKGAGIGKRAGVVWLVDAADSREGIGASALRLDLERGLTSISNLPGYFLQQVVKGPSDDLLAVGWRVDEETDSETRERVILYSKDLGANWELVSAFPPPRQFTGITFVGDNDFLVQETNGRISRYQRE